MSNSYSHFTRLYLYIILISVYMFLCSIRTHIVYQGLDK